MADAVKLQYHLLYYSELTAGNTLINLVDAVFAPCIIPSDSPRLAV